MYKVGMYKIEYNTNFIRGSPDFPSQEPFFLVKNWELLSRGDGQAVTNQSTIPSQYFVNIKDQSPGLIFQFLVSEFFKVFHCSQTMTLHLKEIERSSSQEEVPLLSSLISPLMHLTGPVVDWIPPLPWNTDLGSLNTMALYAELYAKRSGKKNPSATNLAAYVGKSLRYSLQAREALLPYLEPCLMSVQEGGEEGQVQLVLHRLWQLVRSVDRMSQSVLQNFFVLGKEETIIFFLIRHHEMFANLYHRSAVLDLIDQLFRGGIDEAEQFLVKMYGNRGFDHLYPVIFTYIEEIKAASIELLDAKSPR